MATLKSVAIKTWECIISRRGKAAKGTVLVSTFGKPVKPKTGNVIKAWTYDHADNLKLSEVIKVAEEIGNPVEFLLRGMDAVLKSQTIKSMGQTNQLAARLLAEDLAIDKAEAKTVAGKFLSSIQTIALAAMDDEDIQVPTIEQLINGRRKAVAKLKAAGAWKTKTATSESSVSKSMEPRLVKADEDIVEDEDVDVDEDEDVDDEDSEDEDTATE